MKCYKKLIFKEIIIDRLYKLTDQNMRTYGGFQWILGVTPPPTLGEGPLCTRNWYHAFLTPELAILFNPVSSMVSNPRLFEAEGVIGQDDGELKVGCKQLTLIKELPIPVITFEQKIKFGILCAMSVYKGHAFTEWAKQWLDGSNRSHAAAFNTHHYIRSNFQFLNQVAAMTASLSAIYSDASIPAAAAVYAHKSSDDPLNLIEFSKQALT